MEKKTTNATCSCDEICEYIENKVKPGDIVRLSLGMCYIPGEVVTNSGGVIQIRIDSETIKGLTSINIEKLKEFIIEIEHECEEGTCVLEAVDE